MAAPQLALFLPALTFKVRTYPISRRRFLIFFLFLPQELPLLIFGVAGIIGGTISLFLPETLGHPLPDTLLEAAQQGKKGSTKKLWAWWGRKRLEEQVAKQRKLNEELQIDLENLQKLTSVAGD